MDEVDAKKSTKSCRVIVDKLYQRLSHTRGLVIYLTEGNWAREVGFSSTSVGHYWSIIDTCR